MVSNICITFHPHWAGILRPSDWLLKLKTPTQKFRFSPCRYPLQWLLRTGSKSSLFPTKQPVETEASLVKSGQMVNHPYIWESSLGMIANWIQLHGTVGWLLKSWDKTSTTEDRIHHLRWLVSPEKMPAQGVKGHGTILVLPRGQQGTAKPPPRYLQEWIMAI